MSTRTSDAKFHTCETVHAYTIKYGSRFTYPNRPDRVFTMERGDGMYPHVSEILDGKKVMSVVYIGEEVIPHE